MDKQLEAKLTQNLDKLSSGSKMAIVVCAGSFRFGANWGLLRNSNSEYDAILGSLKGEKQDIRVTKLSNGCIVECKETFLAHAVNIAVPNAINGSFVDKAIKRKEDEKIKFTKFMKNVVDGKSKYVKKCKGYEELSIGLYCVNDTNFIRINGQDIPAYKLAFMEALPMMKMLHDAGKRVYIKTVDESNTVNFTPLKDLVGDSKGLQRIFRGMEVSDTDTGVFVTIRFM